METILSTVTDTDQVRSVIGISSKDLSDSQFDTPRVELELTMTLDSKGIDYSTVISEGEGSPTSDQIKRYNYLKLYSIYYCAGLIFPRLRLAAKQKVGDGDNTMERFLDPKFDKLESSYKSKASDYLASLLDAISGITTTETIPSIFSGVPPAYDPVTGS